MHSRAVDKVKIGTILGNGPFAVLYMTIVRCFVSERLLARIVIGDRIFLFGLMPYGSSRGVFTGPAQSGFDVLRAQLFCGIQ